VNGNGSGLICDIILETTKYRVYQNEWSGFEVDYIHKYGEQNDKY